MAKHAQNVGASVRAKLLNLSRQSNQSHNALLARYAHERLLYRLSQSAHRDRFLLKGGMLVATWFDSPHRPTRDIDLWGFGDPSPEGIVTAFEDICNVTIDDGVVFDVKAIKVEPLREHQSYGGLRLTTTAKVGGADLRIAVDIGFGDATEPGPEEVVLQTLLDAPKPRLGSYAQETVIAEKFQAIVMLGIVNTRLKDFYDIWALSRAYAFEDDRLAQAIAATFARRGTVIPVATPDALTELFSGDPGKLRQWANFTRDIAIQETPLAQIIQDMAAFLMPHAARARAISAYRPPP